MNILIISTNRAAAPMPVLPAGACLVAEAAEQAGHSVKLLDLMFKRDPVKAVTEHLGRERYDVIGISIRNIDNNDLHAPEFYLQGIRPVVNAARSASDAVLIAGGAALAVMPEQILRSLNLPYAVVGDGEETFCRLLGMLESAGERLADLPGVASLINGRFRINPGTSGMTGRCPVPDFDRWIDLPAYRSQMATFPIQSKAGCPFQCVYCTYRKIEGETYRLSEPRSVADAALRLTSWGLHDIEFVDNVFNAPPDHAIAVCEALIRSRVRARFQSLELNPAFFSHELLAAMEGAGFTGMGLTVESAAGPVLQAYRKGFTAADVRRAAEIVRGHGIPCVWIFLLGGPGETRETVLETLRFAEKEIGPHDAAFFNIGVRIYPGTGLEAVARAQGVLGVPPEEMLEPVFYLAPDLDLSWLRSRVADTLSRRMGFLSIDSFSFPYLPLIHRVAYRMGVRPPLWRYTRFIRRGLRAVGMKV